MAAELELVLANGDKAGETLKQLRHQAAALNREISTLKPGTEDFVKTSASLNQVKDRMGDIDKQVKGVSASSNHLRGVLGGVLGNIPGFNALSGAIGSLKGGVGGLTSGFGLLRGAIIATGIGALVLAIMGLITWFTKTEAGADLVAKAMAILSAIFRQMTESISRLLSGDFAGFFKGVTTEMVAQVSAANDLADALDALEEKESAFQVIQKAGLRDKAELLKMSKEETLDLQKRIQALDQAKVISDNLNKQELENQREHLKIISGGTAEISDALVKRLEATGLTMENAKEFFKKGNINQDDLNEANEALGKFLDIQKNGFDEERELLVMRNKLVKKERTETHKEVEGLEKQHAERMNFIAQRDEINAANEENRKVAALNQEKKRWEERWLIQYNAIVAANELNAQEIANEKAKQAAITSDYEENIAKRQAVSEALTNQGRSLALALTEAVSTEAKLQIKAGDERLEKIKAQYGEESIEFQKAKREQDRFRREQGERIKRAERAAVMINLFAELATIWRKAAEFGPFQAVVAVAQSAAAGIRARSAIKNINAQQFRQGGFTGPGANDAVAGVVHANEYVVPAGITNNPAYQPMISALEAARLRGYQNGGMVGPRNPFTDRSRGAVSGDGSAQGAVGAAVQPDRTDELIEAVRTMVSNIKVQNVVTETRDAIKTVNTIESEWSV